MHPGTLPNLPALSHCHRLATPPLRHRCTHSGHTARGCRRRRQRHAIRFQPRCGRRRCVPHVPARHGPLLPHPLPLLLLLLQPCASPSSSPCTFLACACACAARGRPVRRQDAEAQRDVRRRGHAGAAGERMCILTQHSDATAFTWHSFSGRRSLPLANVPCTPPSACSLRTCLARALSFRQPACDDWAGNVAEEGAYGGVVAGSPASLTSATTGAALWGLPAGGGHAWFERCSPGLNPGWGEWFHARVPVGCACSLPVGWQPHPPPSPYLK
jgi:hypothetical protein